MNVMVRFATARSAPRVWGLSLLTALALGCVGAPTAEDLYPGPDPEDPIWETVEGAADSSASATVQDIAWDSFVYVPAGAPDSVAQDAVRRQVKSALGALLHTPAISLRDRDARSNLDPRTFTRERLEVVAADGTRGPAIDRVTYRYRDRALVPRTFRGTSVRFAALFGDYAARAAELSGPCGDTASIEPDSLWFHYDPSRSACQALITREQAALNNAASGLPAGTGSLSAQDANRRFVMIRAQLTSTTAPPTTWPETDQLFGFGTDRTKVVVYSFFGVDADDRNPRDYGLVEDLRYVRTLRAAWPGLRVTETQPNAFLLDFTVDGRPLSGVTYEDVAAWVLDGARWPAAANTRAQRDALLAQVRDKWLERWIVWSLPVSVTRGTETRAMTIELRTYYGREDGRPDWRAAARNRYLEAFWHSDVFTYTGHSHFGHGPLEPVAYTGSNFPDRYQVMLFNSCVSYNYYDIDFLDMHPGASARLDVVGNGLAAYWPGMGASTAKLLLGLLDGQGRNWVQILDGMRVDMPGLPRGYEPMRAVTGEEGNRYNGTTTPIRVTPR
ncbi:MAG: hypothetical protein ACK6CU_22035 [Deltaproteobacteria bacterium]|jgi:hypothetical protein